MENATLKFEFTIDQTNALINALNFPSQASAMTSAALINLFQQQAEPQIKELQANEPKTAS
jgi:hypothetical protein